MIQQQTSLFDCVGVVWRAIPLDDANRALESWGHKMGALRRPCFADAAQHGLLHDGRLVAVACTAGLIQDAVGGAPWLDRSNSIELARLCAERPGLCRVALRLWREFTFPTLGRTYAVSYQDADLHTGNVYRFDGWQRVSYSASGTDARSGRSGRRKWVWVYPPRQASNPAGQPTRVSAPQHQADPVAGSAEPALLGKSRFYGHCRDCRHLNTCNLSPLPEGGCCNWEKP